MSGIQGKRYCPTVLIKGIFRNEPDNMGNFLAPIETPIECRSINNE
jgi:hypothetical protein